MSEGARFLVRGRVQGVGFRSFVVHQAAQLGLRGWVRNLVDGRVEVFAWGAPAALSALATALASGPRHSRVSGVEREMAQPGTEDGFVVRW